MPAEPVRRRYVSYYVTMHRLWYYACPQYEMLRTKSYDMRQKHEEPR